MWLSRHPIFLSAAKAWRSSLKRVARSKSSSAMMPANGCLGTIQISRWSVILPVSTKAPRAGEHAGSQARAGGFPATKGQRSPLPPRISPAKPWLDNRQIRIRQLPEKIRITATCRWRMRQRASYRIGNVVAKVLRVID
jgi:hypothetical protein